MKAWVVSTCTNISMWKDRNLSSSRVYRRTCVGQRAARSCTPAPAYARWRSGLAPMPEAGAGSSGLLLTCCVTVKE